ncbi:biotin--acetyl-CoA-carboxylase ligase [Cephaloticoccus primus]|uniref:Bifunctional ligase/repressor BirA n=1 Tax=Cephaloticoccus primus TaxID=1548207 RepID=A0A139SRE1_9BACT|nr:biotin--[acetyl-CoA-carboxylase] ligase [Cephaloticoccus primus]KXU37128.1 biotin--acetyl-CoA-carboxylase ligase [Cephaloticoccus primus]
MPHRAHRPELVILSELTQAAPDYVSGEALAAQLGISRVAVWQHMEKLRAQGFEFETKHSRGYRIGAVPLELHAAYIEILLRKRGRDTVPFSVYDTIDSTNDEAARRLARGEPAPFAILAREQTRGRGRFKRDWQSGKHGNLYSSFAFRPELPPQRMPTFTLWMGVNICELIHTLCGLPAQIKWPNDIVFGRRKCGGILTEARIDADQMRDLVFGFGLNVNQVAGTWGRSLRRPATSLRVEAGRPIDVNHLTAALLGRISLAYSQFVADQYAEQLTTLWEKHDALRGQQITVVNGTQNIEGTACGIDENGKLLLRVGDGTQQRFAAGEVTLESAAAQAPITP